MKGRKPIPSSLKILKGNPGKRAVNREEPHPTVEAPEPPAWLQAEALECWHVIAPELEALGLLTRIDGDALVAYCTVWARWKKAELALVQFGQVVKTPLKLNDRGKVIGGGYPIASPYIGIANKALAHVRAFETEFGMTPSSRARVHVKGQSTQTQAQRFMARAPKLRLVVK